MFDRGALSVKFRSLACGPLYFVTAFASALALILAAVVFANAQSMP
jgi:hypothetical protein